jgi:hypothetical protein
LQVILLLSNGLIHECSIRSVQLKLSMAFINNITKMQKRRDHQLRGQQPTCRNLKGAGFSNTLTLIALWNERERQGAEGVVSNRPKEGDVLQHIIGGPWAPIRGARRSHLHFTSRSNWRFHVTIGAMGQLHVTSRRRMPWETGIL